jgi:hypothetical protein
VPDEVTLEQAQSTINGPRRALNPPEALLCWDPGTLRAGLALFRRGDLAFADAVVAPEGDGIGLRCVTIGRKLQDLLPEVLKGVKRLEVFVEFPEVYPAGGGVRVNPRDILWVSAAVGLLLASLPRGIVVEAVHDVNPKQWKANLSKSAGNDVTLEALFPEERVKLPKKRSGAYDDNMLDAVGMGLHKMKRMRGA